MTPKEYRALLRKNRKKANPRAKATSKHGNKKVEYEGHMFDSKMELKRYKELKLLERAGTITDIELQPKYRLQEGFRYNGKAYRSINYTPDFRYKQGDVVVVEEVKGFADTSYLIRKRLFLFQNPDVIFYELNLKS